VPPGAPQPPPPRPPDELHTDAGTGASTGTSTGTSTGSRSDRTDTGTDSSRYWPFDDPDDTGGFSGKEGRSWMRLAGLVALAIAVLVAMFVAFDIGRGNNDKPSSSGTATPQSPAATGSPIRIVGAQDFDPEGDGEENPDEVHLATDGKQDTGWRTLTYRGNAALGGLKSGVGLVLDLGSEQKVSSVEVHLVGSPTDLELFATAPGDDNPPAELADAHRVSGATADGTTVILRVDPAQRTRYLVVWLTRLPAVPGGFRGEVTEVTVRS
jgi:hypothetical protein